MAKTLLIRRYQPTLIIISVILSAIAVFGFAANLIVVLTFIVKIPKKWVSGRLPWLSTISRRFKCCQATEPTRIMSTEDCFKNEFMLSTGNTGKRDNYGQPIHMHRSLHAQRLILQKNSSHLLILTLAINDLITCAFVLPMTILISVWEESTYDFICRLHVFTKYTVLVSSMFFLLLIAVDRFLIICFVPGIRIKRKLLIFIVASAFVLAMGCSLPVGLRQGVLLDPQTPDYNRLILSNHSLSSETLENSKWWLTLDNYGSCLGDERFITKETYDVYQLYLLILTLIICFIESCIYCAIFVFVWLHQHKWTKGCSSRNQSLSTGGRPRLTKPKENTKEIVDDAEISPVELRPMARGSGSVTRHSPSALTIWTEMMKGNAGSEQRNYSLNLLQAQKDIASKGYCVSECLKGCATLRCRVAPSKPSMHFQTAVMFVLITIAFLFTYLPCLLIGNGIIWKLSYESTLALPWGNASESGSQHGVRQIEDRLGSMTNSAVALPVAMDNTAKLSPLFQTEPETNELVLHIRRMVHYAYSANTVFNSLIYFFMNRTFRERFKLIFHSFCC